MRLLTVLALAFSVTAFAGEYATKKISFTPGLYSGGTTTHYSCWGLENTVESHLRTLGASNISVRCAGGLGSPMGAYISGTFDIPVPTAEDDGAETVVLKGLDSCSFNNEFIEYILPMIPGATVVSRGGACWRGTTAGST